MGLLSFAFDPGHTARFIEFGYEANRDDPRWIPPLRADVEAQLSPDFPFYARPGNDCRRFLALAGGRVVARAMATVNSALRNGGAAVGAVGFFESVDDEAAAADVLGAAVGWLRTTHGIRCIRGPMNFDIWHGYRLMTRGFERERFFGEPANPPYYPSFFERAGFSVCRRWNSFEIPGSIPAEGLSAPGRCARDFEAIGYRFESFGARPFDESVATLYDTLTLSFSSFPGFTPIALADFRDLMSLGRHVIHPRCSTIVWDESGAPAAFAVILVDVADAVRAMNGRASRLGRLRFLWHRRHARRLLLHLGGITPAASARRNGLGRAIFHHAIERVRAEGCREAVGSLVAHGNPVRRLFGAYAGDQSREYALYELAS